MEESRRSRVRLSECLEEITSGVGPMWPRYRVVGATRRGLALAKEKVGKNPERYKLVEPGTIFYNPMRILLGSIALLDEGEEPGITSPDYVVFKTRRNLVHPRWFYYWLRSEAGAAFVRTLTRGAVRERMLFRRLAEAEVEVPAIESQMRFARLIGPLERARAAAEAQLEAAERLDAANLLSVFCWSVCNRWPSKQVAQVCSLLPSKSIANRGDMEVHAITTACLSEHGFRREGLKRARMRGSDATECVVRPGEVLVARSNTPGLVGRACLYEGDPSNVVASDLTIRIAPGPEIEPAFLAGFLSFLYLSGHWQRRAGGASGSMKKITRTMIANLEIPVPERWEQQRIARDLAEALQEFQRVRSAVLDELLAVSQLRPALLRRAFSGEL